MSVCLLELKDPDFDTVEVMAPDYDKRRFWLCEGDERVNLSIEQAKALRDFLVEELPI